MNTFLAFGCSQTYGDALPDTWQKGNWTIPSQYAWPKITSDILNMDLINYGRCGNSCNTISRNVFYIIEKRIKEKQSLDNLYIGIFWSYPARFEYVGNLFDKKYNADYMLAAYNISAQKIYQEMNPTTRIKNKIFSFVEIDVKKDHWLLNDANKFKAAKYFYDYLYDPELDAYDNLKTIIFTANYLKSKNINFNMHLSSSLYEDLVIFTNKHDFTNFDLTQFLKIKVDDEYYLADELYFKQKQLFPPALDGQHLGVEAHRALGETFAKAYKNNVFFNV